MGPAKEIRSKCYFFDKDLDDTSDMVKNGGFCRRFPPVRRRTTEQGWASIDLEMKSWRFAIVQQSDWCGEFRPKKCDMNDQAGMKG